MFVQLLMLMPNAIFADTEVAEACQWLRAAGFPQYARMYEGEKEEAHCSSVR